MVCLITIVSSCTAPSSNYSERSLNTYKPVLEFEPISAEKSLEPGYLELHQKYKQWLVDQELTPNRMELLLANASQNLLHIVGLQSGDVPEMQFPPWFVAGGAIPNDNQKQANTDHSALALPHTVLPEDFTPPSIHSALYLGNLFQNNICYEGENRSLIDSITVDEYRHLHSFLLNENIWTKKDYLLAESAISQYIDNNTGRLHVQC